MSAKTKMYPHFHAQNKNCLLLSFMLTGHCLADGDDVDHDNDDDNDAAAALWQV